MLDSVMSRIDILNLILWCVNNFLPSLNAYLNGSFASLLLYSIFSFSISCCSFVSFMIFPSFNSMILSPYSNAYSLLCVTNTTNISLLISFNKSITSFPVFLSNAPVGSSAKIILGPFTKIRAIPTLCFCPPDNSYIFLFSYPSNPIFFSSSLICSGFSFPFCSCSNKAIFS